MRPPSSCDSRVEPASGNSRRRALGRERRRQQYGVLARLRVKLIDGLSRTNVAPTSMRLPSQGYPMFRHQGSATAGGELIGCAGGTGPVQSLGGRPTTDALVSWAPLPRRNAGRRAPSWLTYRATFATCCCVVFVANDVNRHAEIDVRFAHIDARPRVVYGVSAKDGARIAQIERRPCRVLVRHERDVRWPLRVEARLRVISSRSVKNVVRLEEIDERPRVVLAHNGEGVGRSVHDVGRSVRDVGRSVQDVGRATVDVVRSMRDVGRATVDVVRSIRDVGRATVDVVRSIRAKVFWLPQNESARCLFKAKPLVDLCGTSRPSPGPAGRRVLRGLSQCPQD